MNYFLFLLPVITISFFSLFLCIILYKYIKLNSQCREFIVFFKKISHTLSSARYGNLYSRIDFDKNNKLMYEISKNLNDLFESVLDRDEMIKEYIQKEKEDIELKEDFIAALTHDLKVPIAAQDNTYDLFLTDKFGALSTYQKEAIEKLKVSNMDLKYMVEALLETYKAEHKGVNIKKEENILIKNFLNDTINQISSIFDLHGKKIYYLTEKNDDYLANIDIFLVKRVVNNLILNALQYSGNSDRVDVYTKCEENHFSISIKDYGAGINEDEINKIFNKYYSGKNNNIRTSTGLGLYLSNKIIKVMGGTIAVESKKSEGSIFTVTIPKK